MQKKDWMQCPMRIRRKGIELSECVDCVILVVVSEIWWGRKVRKLGPLFILISANNF